MSSSEYTKDMYECIRLGSQFCFPLYACAKEIVRQYRQPLETLNLTYTQYVVMMALWEHGGMTEGELGKIVRLDSGTLTPLLKRLEKQGYINRIKPGANERRLFISLTETGEALKDKALFIPSVINGIFGLAEEELQQLKDLLEKALSEMDSKQHEEIC